MMFPKDSWVVDDRLIVKGVHGKIVEFSSTNARVKFEHRDNENQIYYRWYDVKDLPPFPTPAPDDKTIPLPDVEAEEVTPEDVTVVMQAPESLRRGAILRHRTLNYQRIVAKVDGLVLEFGMGCGKGQWDSSVWEIVRPDEDTIAAILNNADAQYGRIAELEKTANEHINRLAKQAATIGEFMKTDDESLQDKYEQLHDDYEGLEKELAAAKAERDSLKTVNAQQSELLKQAAAPSPTFSTAINKDTLLDSLRSECSILHKENDKLKADMAKALKSPHDALEQRLARMEEKLDVATDWIEGAVERSMDEAERGVEAQMNPPVVPANVIQAFMMFQKAWTLIEDVLANKEDEPKPAA